MGIILRTDIRCDTCGAIVRYDAPGRVAITGADLRRDLKIARQRTRRRGWAHPPRTDVDYCQEHAHDAAPTATAA